MYIGKNEFIWSLGLSFIFFIPLLKLADRTGNLGGGVAVVFILAIIGPFVFLRLEMSYTRIIFGSLVSAFLSFILSVIIFNILAKDSELRNESIVLSITYGEIVSYIIAILLVYISYIFLPKENNNLKGIFIIITFISFYSGFSDNDLISLYLN